MDDNEFKKYDDNTLKHLQDVELMIFKDVIKVLDDNNLPYYMYAGSALGTVRHEGFIPWDDDIDIVMFRKDYEKAIDILSKKLDDKYEVCTIHNNKFFFFGFMKIYLKDTFFDTYYYRIIKEYVDFTPNIFIDIFPLDNIPSNKYIYKFFIFMNYALFHFNFNYYPKLTTDSKVRNLFLRCVHFFVNIFPIMFWKKLYYSSLTFFNGKNKEEVAMWCNGVYNPFNPPIYKNKDFEPFIFGKFEGLDVKLPHNYDSILVESYGDYMKLPPKEERYNHAPNKIDFGKY